MDVAYREIHDAAGLNAAGGAFRGGKVVVANETTGPYC